MISVSRAAGYGKFTQTNDSHLPEARDTIEKEGAREKRRRRRRREREGRGLNTRAMISNNSICIEKMLTFLPH